MSSTPVRARPVDPCARIAQGHALRPRLRPASQDPGPARPPAKPMHDLRPARHPLGRHDDRTGRAASTRAPQFRRERRASKPITARTQGTTYGSLAPPVRPVLASMAAASQGIPEGMREPAAASKREFALNAPEDEGGDHAPTALDRPSDSSPSGTRMSSPAQHSRIRCPVLLIPCVLSDEHEALRVRRPARLTRIAEGISA